MKKNYYIRLSSHNFNMEERTLLNEFFNADLNDFNDKVLLVDYICTLLAEYGSMMLYNESLKLYVISEDDHVLFKDEEALDLFMEEHKMQYYMSSATGANLVINGIPYRGEITEGMIKGDVLQ